MYRRSSNIRYGTTHQAVLSLLPPIYPFICSSSVGGLIWTPKFTCILPEPVVELQLMGSIITIMRTAF